jgi:hypothetical protein
MLKFWLNCYRKSLFESDWTVTFDFTLKLFFEVYFLNCTYECLHNEMSCLVCEAKRWNVTIFETGRLFISYSGVRRTNAQPKNHANTHSFSLSFSLSHTHTHMNPHTLFTHAHTHTHTLWHKSLLAWAWWRKTFWFAFSPFCTSYSAQRCLDEQRLSFCNHCTFDLIIFLHGLSLSVVTKRRLWECLSYYVH